MQQASTSSETLAATRVEMAALRAKCEAAPLTDTELSRARELTEQASAIVESHPARGLVLAHGIRLGFLRRMAACGQAATPDGAEEAGRLVAAGLMSPAITRAWLARQAETAEDAASLSEAFDMGLVPIPAQAREEVRR